MPKQQRPNGTPRKKLSIAALDRTFADRWALSHLGRIWGFVSSLSDGHRMGVPPQKHCLSPSRRRALDLLASSPDGATKETIVRVYGISRDINRWPRPDRACNCAARDRQGWQRDDQSQALSHHERGPDGARRVAGAAHPSTALRCPSSLSPTARPARSRRLGKRPDVLFRSNANEFGQVCRGLIPATADQSDGSLRN
jgi:hypothetical protein